MSEKRVDLPREYHEAVLHWQRHNFPDYDRLADAWEHGPAPRRARSLL